MAAIRASHPGKTLFEVTTSEVLLHDIPDHGPEVAIGSGEALFVNLLETLVVGLNNFEEGALTGLPLPVDSLQARVHTGKRGKVRADAENSEKRGFYVVGEIQAEKCNRERQCCVSHRSSRQKAVPRRRLF